jgi:hypothetical protein
MISQKTSKIYFLVILLAVSLLTACRASNFPQEDQGSIETLPGAIPTWTALIKEEPSAGISTATIQKTMTPTLISPSLDSGVNVTAMNGNMNIRRGPGVDYNPIGVLTDGASAVALGRDRVRRWLYIESPTSLGPTGWVSLLTQFTEIEGDVDALPVVEVDPAFPAFIRNCTKHTLWVLPAQVELLPKVSKPYNEERFPPGEYKIYDLDVSSDGSIDEINLREGLTVEVIRDGNDEKSKCE